MGRDASGKARGPVPVRQPDAVATGVTPVGVRLGAAARSGLVSLAAIGVAMLVGALVIAVSGDDPVLAYRALLSGAFGDRRGVAETLVASTPLILGGLAFAVASRAGLFNIGIEGQLVLGGLAAGLVAAYGLGGAPAAVHLPLAIGAGMAVGAVWGAIPGVLKARTGASEVITTIMLNYIAYRISAFAIGRDDLLPVNPDRVATDPALPGARLARILDGTRLHAGILLAIAAAVILWYLLFQTTTGYRIRAVGLSRGAAAYAGISWGRTITVAMVLSGALAGLAGTSEALGLQGRHYDQPPGYGFTAIAVGLVGRNHPLGVVLAGLLFGALNAGATEMQSTAGTSKELVQVLQGLVILAVAGVAAAERFRVGQWFAARFGGPRAGRAGSDRASAVGMEPDLEPRAGPPAL